jgi:4-amino-4-deoxy-L-arabinose transferase-like glycosyltransferase
MVLGGFKRALLATTIIGLVVRFACLEIAYPIRLTGDEVYFAKVAANIAAGKGHVYDDGSRASWPPANAYYMSWFVDPGKFEAGPAGLVETIKTMMVGQVILGSLFVPLIMVLAVMLFDKRTSLFAGLITAFYPTFIAYSHYLWAENIFVVLTLGGLILAYKARRAGGFGLPVLAGVLFGLATLSRETGLAIACACGLWWVWCPSGAGRRHAIVRAVLMVLVAVLVVAPWTIRNYRLLGGFIPVGTISWMAMAEGNTFDPDDWLHPNRDILQEFRTSWRSIHDEVARMAYSRRVALERISEEQPTWLFKKLVLTSGLLFSPDSFLFKKISRGAYGSLPLAVIRLLLVVTVASYLFVAVAGMLGIAIAPDRIRRLLPIVVVGTVFLLHVAAFTSSRHRLPLVALLIPYAAYAAVHRHEIRGLLSGRRWVVPAIILVWFFVLCVPYFFNDAVSIWRSGTYVNAWRP